MITYCATKMNTTCSTMPEWTVFLVPWFLHQVIKSRYNDPSKSKCWKLYFATLSRKRVWEGGLTLSTLLPSKPKPRDAKEASCLWKLPDTYWHKNKVYISSLPRGGRKIWAVPALPYQDSYFCIWRGKPRTLCSLSSDSWNLLLYFFSFFFLPLYALTVSNLLGCRTCGVPAGL